MSASNYLEDKLLDHALKGTAYTQPDNIYLALFTTDPTDAGTGTEVSGTNYARVDISSSFAASSSGTKTTNADITFAAAGSGGFGTVTHLGIYDASTEGNLIFHGSLSASKEVSEGDIFQITSGNLSISLD
jgi:hypothetical protein